MIPGDANLAAADEVVVIPPALAMTVAERGIDDEDEEEWIRMKLARGASLHEVYPPNAAARQEREAWRQDGRPPRQEVGLDEGRYLR